MSIWQFRKQRESPPRPSWEAVVEMMHGQNLDGFSDEVADVLYSRDKDKRYIVLKKENGNFTYQLQELYQYDEDEWNYISGQGGALPGMWVPFRWDIGKSIFENKEELLRELQAEPEYKRYFE